MAYQDGKLYEYPEGEEDISKASYLTEEEKMAAVSEMQESRYWLNQITSVAKQEAQPWERECEYAWREYQGQKADGLWRARRDWFAEIYPRYWSDTELMLPALYSRIPKPVARRRFDSPDPIARTASTISERLATWLIDTSDFDKTMTASALGFLNTNRQTCRIFFVPETFTRTKRNYIQVTVSPDTGEDILLELSGEAVPDDVVVLNDDQGEAYYELEGQTEEVQAPKIITRPVQFDELRISPGARSEAEIWWMAYKITITRKNAVELFGEEKVRKCKPSNPKTDETSTEYDAELKPSEDLFEYWECWNKRDKCVYWLHESLKTGFLKEAKDIYELQGFYPSPRFMVDNQRFECMYPVPDYTQCKDPYEQLHILYKRQNAITRAIRGRALYDGSDDNLVSFFQETNDNEGIASNKWQDIVEKGGVDSLIYYQDTSKLAATLREIMGAFAQAKLDVDELRGITDLIRGTSDPVTSATAEKIKDRRASLRFSRKQKTMLQFAKETIQLMLDLAYKTFEADYLKLIIGFSTLTPSDQQNFDQALAMLKSDTERTIRIDIETDTLTAFEDEDRKQKTGEALANIGSYMKNIQQTIAEEPLYAPPLLQLLGAYVRSLDQAKDAEDPIAQSFTAVLEKLNEPPPPPPPDIEQMKLESAERMKQMDLQMRNAELQQKGFELQLTTNLEQQKLQMEASLKQLALQQQENFKLIDTQLQMIANQLKGEDLQVKREALVASSQDKMLNASIKANDSQFDKQMRVAEHQLEQQYVGLDMEERYLTEQRLQQEAIDDKERDTTDKAADLQTKALDTQKEIEKEKTKQVEALATAQGPSPVQVSVNQPGIPVPIPIPAEE